MQIKSPVIKISPKQHKKVGSILCFSIEPKTKSIYFLLGQEKYNKSWPQGSMKWSGFGGIVKQNESIERGAAREFVEETLGVIPNMDNVDTIETMLINHQYWRKFIYERNTGFIATCFVKEIEWDPTIPTYFKKRSHHLNNLRSLPTFYVFNDLPQDCKNHPAIKITQINNIPKIIVHKDYLEKKQLKWWSIYQLLYEIEHEKYKFRKAWLWTIIPVFKRIYHLLAKYELNHMTLFKRINTVINKISPK
jgi:8-oxo-dGTP pyrophosphatase MutT (NUDIX family)